MTPEEPKHIIDILIAERAGRLRRNTRLWALTRRFVYPLLEYRQARLLADDVRELSGQEVLDYVSDLLQLRVSARGTGYVPREGLAFVTPNHPAGIADGVGLYNALKKVRKDICFFANRDAIRIAPRLAEVIIPVEWVAEKRSSTRQREALTSLSRAIRAEKLIVLFPSGRLARPSWRGLREQPWQNTALKIAIKHRCPVVPLHIESRNSLLFYLFAVTNQELRDMTLFRELLNKTGRRYRLNFGEAFYPHRLDHSADTLTQALQNFTERDLKRKNFSYTGTALESGDCAVAVAGSNCSLGGHKEKKSCKI